MYYQPIDRSRTNDGVKKWRKILKYLLDDLVPDRFTNWSNQLEFRVKYHRYLSVVDTRDNSRLVELQLSPVRQQIIFDLLHNVDNLNRYKMLITHTNSELYLTIYVANEYLETLCVTYQVAPRLIETLLRNCVVSEESANFQPEIIQVCKNVEISDSSPTCSYIKKLKIKPFTHQKNNVSWMQTLEQNVNNGLHKVDYIVTSDLIKSKLGKHKFFLDEISGIIYNEDSLWKFTERVSSEVFKGGVLCDQVGLGKTLSMTCLILANPPAKIVAKPTIKISLKTQKPNQTPTPTLTLTLTDASDTMSMSTSASTSKSKTKSIATNFSDLPRSNATLIYCPRRLVGQWISEISKYTDRLSVVELSTMIHVGKHTVSSLCQADVIVVSFSLLTNKNYREQSKIDLTRIYWHRVIVDEGHEVLVHNVKKADDIRTNTEIMSTVGKYKWVCTGTPLPDGQNSMQGIISFLTNKNLKEKSTLLENLSLPQSQKLVEMLFHRNTEESSKGEIFIPKVIESTDYLEFTSTERAIYNNAETTGDTTKMMQLCTNIMISDDTSSVLKGKAMTLNQINAAMSTHYRSEVERLRLAIADAKIEAQEIEDEGADEVSELEDQLKFAKIALKNDPKNLLLKADVDEATRLLHNKKASVSGRLKTVKDRIDTWNVEIAYDQGQVSLYTSLNLTELMTKTCPITGKRLDSCGDIVVTPSGQCYSRDGLDLLFKYGGKAIKCPVTRDILTSTDLLVVKDPKSTADQAESSVNIERNRWGTKMAHLVNLLKKVFEENHEHKVIIFSQWNKMLDMISQVLEDYHIEFVFCRGNVHMMSKSIHRFKHDQTIKVILLCSESCSSGSNLTEATHIFLMDTVNTTAENARAIEEQAVARAVRLGQRFNVQVKRFIMKDTIEEEHHRRNQGNAL